MSKVETLKMLIDKAEEERRKNSAENLEKGSGLKSRTIVIDQIEELEGLGVEPKARITGTLVHKSTQKKERPITLIERSYYPHLPMNITEVWKRCKAAGLPVPRTMRQTEKETFLVTDYKVKGREIFGKAHLLKRRHSNASLTWMESYFLNWLTDERIQELSKQASAYSAKATQNQIELPYDDTYELVLYPDGNFKVVLLDLSSTIIYDKLDQGAKGQLDSQNQHFAEKFIQYLKQIKDILENIRDKQYET